MDENKAIDILRVIAPPRTSKKAFYDFMEARDMAIAALEQAQPKRGKWVKISPANIYECSKCGKNVMTNDISEYNFCHGCGADMRGDSDDIN